MLDRLIDMALASAGILALIWFAAVMAGGLLMLALKIWRRWMRAGRRL